MLVRMLVGSCLLVLVAGCGPSTEASQEEELGWISLFDGRSFNNWTMVGDANWQVSDGAVGADSGTGFLVTLTSYADFQMRAEAWADDEANSGIFIRCMDPAMPSAQSCYEVNIYDQRPEPAYGTGAIVNVAPVSPMPKAGGRWNLIEIEARGPQLLVTFNGLQTVATEDDRLVAGPIALQRAAGTIRFRKVEIRPL